MDPASLKKLKRKTYLLFPLSFIGLTGMLMLLAGTLNYWQGWIWCAVVFAFAFFVTLYFLKKSPEFLERRMMFKEKEQEQKTIIKISNLFFSIGFILSVLDYRFGWSVVPTWLVLIADAVTIAGYIIIFLAFKENAFAGRTIETFKGQKVIDTGPYALVRHPMYSGIIPLFLVMPLALGSFWGLIPFAFVLLIIILRILNEEKVLKRDLPGYEDYCKKVRYRLVPLVW
ncbi:MAG: isoprenylcysteine carboxylmethyltransferase family protein [Patescibacteria group bacterium]|jgi:protein-S-isoprenylcysteine O-methyltransferase Ste14